MLKNKIPLENISVWLGRKEKALYMNLEEIAINPSSTSEFNREKEIDILKPIMKFRGVN